jgi:hypothetical protein
VSAQQQKDVKLAELNEFTVTAVKSLSLNQTVVIRKIVEVVSAMLAGSRRAG